MSTKTEIQKQLHRKQKCTKFRFKDMTKCHSSGKGYIDVKGVPVSINY